MDMDQAKAGCGHAGDAPDFAPHFISPAMEWQRSNARDFLRM
jgi:hypothetical protein